MILNRVACRLSFQATTSRRALPRFYEADQRQFDRGRSGNSEIAANLLISIRRKCRCFSEICERLLEIPPDFDSAIPWFESRRPSQKFRNPLKALYRVPGLVVGAILKFIPPFFLKFRSCFVRSAIGKHMRMTFAGCCEHAILGALGIAVIGVTGVC